MRKLATLALVGFVGIASAQSNNHAVPQVTSCVQAADTRSDQGGGLNLVAASGDIWRKTVGVLVKEPLWSDRDA